jgi:hypothetical protein
VEDLPLSEKEKLDKEDPLSIEMTPERWALGRSMNGYPKPPWTPPIPPEDLSNYKKRKESVVNSFLDGLIYFLEGFRQS